MTLQTSGSSVHVGSSTYEGNLTQEKVYDQTRKIIKGGSNVEIVDNTGADELKITFNGVGGTVVHDDSTLIGGGVSGNPLKVKNPFTLTDEAKITSLEKKTFDLVSGTDDSTGWVNVTSPSSGGIYSSNNSLSLTQAQGLSDLNWKLSIEGQENIENHLVVRIPASGDSPEQYRVSFVSGAGTVFEAGLSSFSYLGKDTDWRYYSETHTLGGDVASLTLQGSGSSTRVGSSTYEGNLTQEKVYDQTVKIIKGGNGITVNENGSTETISIESSGVDIGNASLHAISELQDKTFDLTAGPKSAHWENTDGNDYGMATQSIEDGAYDLTQARSATYTPNSLSNPGVNYLVVRTPFSIDQKQVRLLFESTTGITYTLSLTSLNLLGNDNSENYKYYGEGLELGGSIRSITLQLNESTAHHGKSTFGGKVIGTVGEDIVGIDSLKEDITDRLLPNAGGETGKVLGYLNDSPVWVDENGFTTRGLESRVEGLETKTQDIIPGPNIVGWRDTNSNGQGGIYVSTTEKSLNDLAGISDSEWSRSSTKGNVNRHLAVRIPQSEGVSKYRIKFESNTGIIFYDNLTSFQTLGERGNNWKYYGEEHSLGADLKKLTLQITISTAHEGSSTYEGNLTKEKVYSQVHEILKEGSKITLTRNDSLSELSISSSGGNTDGLTTVLTDGTTIEGNGKESVLKLKDSIIGRLLPVPTDDAEDNGKVAALNTTGTGYELVDPSGDGSEALHAIEVLQDKTSDLVVGPPSGGWQNSTGLAQGGMAVRSENAFSLTTAQSATYSIDPANPGGKFLAVRLPVNTDVGQARVVLTSSDNLTYTLQLSSFHKLGSDSNWDWYGENIKLGTNLATLRLQLTGSATHLGTSTFKGNLTQEKIYEQNKIIIKAGSNVTITPNDSADTITINSTGSSGSSGLSEVSTDTTLSGDGTSSNTLKVVNPFTPADETKLDGIAANAIAEVVSDGTLTGKGITGDTLKVANPYTTAEKNKLAGLQNFVLADGAVGTAKIANNAVTSEKLADGSVDEDALGNNAVVSGKIKDGAVVAAKLDAELTKRVLPVPTNDANDAKKVAALNAQGTAYELVTQSGSGGDSAVNVNPLNQRLEALEAKTSDLQAGQDATGWDNAVNNSQGGIYSNSSARTLEQVKDLNNNLWSLSLTSGISQHLVVRIPASSNATQYQIRFISGQGGQFDSDLTAFSLLGSDSNWKYYQEVHVLGNDISSLTLRVTGSAAHIGTSRFSGNLVKEKIILALGNGAINTALLKDNSITVDKLADAIVDRLLPGSLGTAGQVLQVNSGATAVEYATPASSGSSGLSKVSTDTTLSGDGTSSNTLKVVNPFTPADETKLDGIAANAIAEVVSDGTLTGKGITGDTLRVAIPFTQEEKTKLSNISGTTGGSLSEVEYQVIGTSTTISSNYTNVLAEPETTALPDVFYLEVKGTVGLRTLYEVYPTRKSEVSSEKTFQFAHTSAVSLKVKINSGGKLQMRRVGDEDVFTSASVVVYVAKAPRGQKGEPGDSGVTTVSTDGTIDGDGSAGGRLSLADGAVSTAKIVNNAVTTAKLANDSVNEDKLTDGVVERLLPEPTDNQSDSGKIAALNNTGDGYVLVAQDDSTLTKQRLEALEAKTSDLQAGRDSTGWVNANTESQGGIYSSSSSQSLTQVKALTDNQWNFNLNSGIGAHLSVRIPRNEDAGKYQVRFISRGNTTFDEALTGFSFLGADDDWKYYSELHVIGGDIASLTLRVTGSAAHIGTSTFSGNLEKDKVIASVGSGGITTSLLDSATTERLLPAPTDSSDDGGKFAALKADGTGYELVGSRRDISYNTVGSSVSISGTYANILTSAETTVLPDSFYLEIKGTVGSRGLYDVFPVRKAALSANVEYQFAHSPNLGLSVRINNGRLQVKTVGSILSASALVYIAKAAAGPAGPPGPVANADRLLPEPTDTSGDAGKIAALNSSGTAYELVAQSGSLSKRVLSPVGHRSDNNFFSTEQTIVSASDFSETSSYIVTIISGNNTRVINSVVIPGAIFTTTGDKAETPITINAGTYTYEITKGGRGTIKIKATGTLIASRVYVTILS